MTALGGTEMKKFLAFVTVMFFLIMGITKVMANPYLKCISFSHKILIGPTSGDGKETFAQARGVFGNINSDDQWWLNFSTTPTIGVEVKVCEVVRDATFNQLFSSLGDLDRLSFTNDQFVEFCGENREWLASGKSSGTIFLVKDSEGKPFVAVASRYSLPWKYKLENDHVLHAKLRHRLVIPGQ